MVSASSASTDFLMQGCRWALRLDRIDAIGIEGDVVLDLGDRSIGSFVGPHRVHRPVPAAGNAVVRAVALVRTVGRMLRSLQQGHVDILAGDIVDRRVRGLPQYQGVLSI